VYSSGKLGSLLYITKIVSQKLNITQAGGGNIMPRKSGALFGRVSPYQAGLKTITKDL